MIPSRTVVLSISLFALGAALDCAVAADQPGQATVATVDQALPALEAAATMQVPDGFKVTLFAGEPDVQQPIGFCIDDRGRLWVAEAYGYPKHSDQPGSDRILIFEDTNNDGVHDKRTVFYDKLNYVSGIEVGFGGVWVMSPPYLYFIADKNADDIPDGEPEVLLDGFGNHANSHNIANGFAWGPDGWLYGTHGRTNWSMIGKPGATEAERQRFDGGVWRYHPIRHEWEAYADGTTNPWGIDWNEYGEVFMSNCVNPHLFHVIQGAHYEPWRGRQSSQYAYQRIDSIADHLHYVAGDHTAVDSDEIRSLGGGHAHCGMMIYQGTNWPKQYRNTVFMNNIHGKRINNDLPERRGSGYIATHGDDFALSKDPWFMGVTLQYGPDGGVFVLDWSDTGECHSTTHTRRETGRIFKITYGEAPPEMPKLDLAKRSHLELTVGQMGENTWLARHSRRILQERVASGLPHDLADTELLLYLHLQSAQAPIPERLRSLWTLHVTDRLTEQLLQRMLDDSAEHLRAWSIRLLCEDRNPPAAALQKFADLAADDPSPLVRRYLASALQRLPHDQRWPSAEAFVTHAKDADDQNLPLLYWYAIEPLVATDFTRFLKLGTDANIALLRTNTARRAVEFENAVHLPAVTEILLGSDSAARRDILTGILLALDDLGIHDADIPASWTDSYAALQSDPNDEVRHLATRLALRFNDPIALQQLNDRALDRSLSPSDRTNALQALIDKGTDDLGPLLRSLLADQAVRNVAIRGLAACDDLASATDLLKHYCSFDASARRDAVQTLASHPEWATALLDAVDTGSIEKSDISAFAARQMQNLGDKKLTARLQKSWGELRKPSKGTARAIENYRKKITPPSIASADPHEGRGVFQNLCASCHKMFGEGGEVGPEITGSQRTNIDYLLEKLIDPSAAVAKDFQLVILETTGGRTLSGFIRSENDSALTLQSINEQIVVRLADIKKRSPVDVSIMPEGLLQTMTTTQIRNLFAYLSSPGQVEPAEK